MTDTTETDLALDAPDDGIEVIEFTTKRTKASRDRENQSRTIKVDLVGVEYELLRPKDFRLFAFTGATSDLAAEPDTWYQTIRLIDEIFDPVDRKSFFSRACDREDPLNAGAVFDMLEQLSDRWSATTQTAAERPVMVTEQPHMNTGLEPVRIETDDFGEHGLNQVFHPPKDLLLGMVASVLSTQADEAAVAWAVGLFLDGALTKPERRYLERRLHTRYGDLDLEDLLDLVNTLLERWHPEAKASNRQARRTQAAKKRKTTAKAKPKPKTAQSTTSTSKTKTVRPATKLNPPKKTKGE